MDINSKQRLAQNTAWNLLGNGLPLLVAFVSIPILIRSLGAERFGILSLIWMVIGYFSFFDLGIGRATTKFVAERLSIGDLEAIPPIFWNSVLLLSVLGLLIGLLVLVLVPTMVQHFLSIPIVLQNDAQWSFSILATSLPLVLVATGIRGALEGVHSFKVVNAIKIPTNIALIAAPLLVLPFSEDLYPIVLVLVLSRALSLFFYLYYCIKTLPLLKQYSAPSLAVIKELITFGGWLTVTNIVGTLIAMGYIDRLMISSLLTIESVTYYVTPFEMISRLWIFPHSLMGVLFPLFSACMATEKDRLAALHRSAVIYVLFLLVPAVIVTIVLARPFLTFWIGAAFADQSTAVLQLFAVGILASSISQVPFAVIQSIGRPDLTAKRHLWELPFYIGIMWYGITTLGILGAALTWLLWASADMLILFWMARRLFTGLEGNYLPMNSAMVTSAVLGCLVAAYYGSFLASVAWQIVLMFVLLAGIMTYAWKGVMNDTDKSYLKALIRRAA